MRLSPPTEATCTAWCSGAGSSSRCMWRISSKFTSSHTALARGRGTPRCATCVARHRRRRFKSLISIRLYPPRQWERTRPDWRSTGPFWKAQQTTPRSPHRVPSRLMFIGRRTMRRSWVTTSSSGQQRRGSQTPQRYSTHSCWPCLRRSANPRLWTGLGTGLTTQRSA